MPNILIPDMAGNFATLAADDAAGGVVVLRLTSAAPTSFVALWQPNGQVLKLGTVFAAGVHTVCYTPG